MVSDVATPTDPTIPNYSVVPSYCGNNTFAASTVKSVCVAVVRADATQNLRVPDVLLITYSNGTKEVMPIISQSTRPAAADNQIQEDLILYANNSLAMKDYMIMDTRAAMLTSQPTQKGTTPTAIEGRTATNQYFIVGGLQFRIL